jgi:Protein of unknown function (DUF2800)
MSKELTPSMAPKLAECAVFVGASGASAAAERGTAIDLAIRLAMDGDTSPIDQLTGDDLTAATWGIETLRRLSGGEHVETREEYLAMAVPGLSKLGTADAICKRARWVADIKTGAVRGYRQQLAAYSLACMEDHFAESWTAHVVYVDQQLVRSYDFTRAEAEATTQRWIAEATSADAKPTPCEYCQWCQHFNSCVAITRQAESALALVKTDGRTLDEIRAEIAADPIQMSVFAANWKTAEKHIAEPVIELLKKRLADGEEIPGWKVSTSAGREYVEAAAIVKASENVSKETLILALGGKMTGAKFREFCAAGGVEVDETAIKAGSPIATLRQTKTK